MCVLWLSFHDMVARKPRRHAGEHDLIEALDQSGCPVCHLAAEAVDAFLASVCYEQVNDLELREQLRTAGGFCRPHARAFLGQPHGRLAAAIVYRDVLVNAARRLERRGGGPRGRLAGFLGKPEPAPTVGPDARRCPACRVLTEAEERHLATLRGRLTDPAIRERYRAADGLCLPHLDRALRADDDGAHLLAVAAVEQLGALVDDLDEYIRKHDYRFRTEVWQGEDNTPARAVERAVGTEKSGP